MYEKFLSKIIGSTKAVFFIVAVIIVSGGLIYRSLKVDLFPPLNFPILNIITELPSYSSIEMERQVTVPLESAIGAVQGVRKVRSTSGTGISMVSAEFEWGTDMLVSRQRLIEGISSVRAQLPHDAEPGIENLSTSLAMIEGYSFKGGSDLVKLRDIALYDLKPRLQRLPGVYKVIVMGGSAIEYSIKPNPAQLIKYDLSLTEIQDALTNNNILASPGIINQHAQELVIHANGQFENADDISSLVVAIKNGTPIPMRDLAVVSRSVQYERGDTSEAGEPSVHFNIFKQPSFDTEAVAKAVDNEIRAFSKNLGPGYTIKNFYDQGQLVSDSIGSVKESVVIGGILVILVLAFFLGDLRTTFIATLSIPISVAVAIILMKTFGISLNIMSLGGLAIGTGIIVDDTIVVLENIFRWLSTPSLREGREVKAIILGATVEVLRPVIVSTFTNIAIFLPMIFVEGFAGKLFAPVSFTVTFALLASLVVALTVIPILALKWLSHRLVHEEKENRIQRVYRWALPKLLRRPKLNILLAISSLVLVFFVFKRLEVEFLPALDEGAVLLQTIMPPGTSLEESKRLSLKIENWVKQIPGVETVVRRTGHAPGAEDTDNVNHSDITVKLVPKSKRPFDIDGFSEALKAKTSKLPSMIVNYLMPLADKINDALGGVSADIGVDLFGPDLDQLRKIANDLTKRLQVIPGLVDLRPPSDIPVPTLEIKLKKAEAGRLGISEKSIFDTVEAYSIGLQVTSVRDVQKEFPVVIHLANTGADVNLESLESLPVKALGGPRVPLKQVAEFSYADLPNEVNHEHMSRKMTITANTKGRNAADVAKDIEKSIVELKLPSGYSWGFTGKYETEQAALINMLVVMALAIFVVSIILWIEFRSLIEVALILITIPLAAVGAVLSLWVTGETINVSSMIGATLLVGIVVRNGIMMLDYMGVLLDQGQPLLQAVQGAAVNRVRPILMTATVTILGLLPLAAGWGTGAELQKPLAIAVIGGLFTSTLLTLIILPSAVIVLMRDRPHSPSQMQD